MSKGKNTRPVFDWLLSLHMGIALGKADGLFGVRINDKLAWPPAQVDSEHSVERFPTGVDLLKINRGMPVTEAIAPDHKEVMTTQREEIIDQTELFGGDEASGGVYGMMVWMPGGEDQVPPAYVDEKLNYEPGTAPGFRGYSSAFFTGARQALRVRNALGAITGIAGVARVFARKGFRWCSNNPFQPAPEFRVFRAPRAKPLSDWCDSVATQTNANLASERNVLVIPGPYDPARRDDEGNALRQGGGFPRANPAAFLYELFATRGYHEEADDSIMDAESFLTAARIFSKEGLGVSFYDANADGFNDIIAQVCNHASCGVVLDRRTGKFVIRVMRHRSVFEGLWSGRPAPRPELRSFVLTPSNADITGEIRTRVAAELASSMTVKYTVDETEEMGIINLMSQAAIAISGGARNEDRDYSLFRDSAAAITAGKRELAFASTPMTTFDAVLSREAWDLNLFDIINVSWPDEPAIHGKQFLVAEISYGDTKNREITVTLAEHVADIVHPNDVEIATRLQERRHGATSVAPKVERHYPTPMSAPMLIASGVTRERVEQMDEDGVVTFAHLVSSGSNLDAATVFQHPIGTPVPEDGDLIEPTPRAAVVDPLPGGEAFSTLNFYDLDFGANAKDVNVGDKLIFVRNTIPGVTLIPIADDFQTGNRGAISANIQLRKYASGDGPESPNVAVGSAALALDPESDTMHIGYGLRPYYTEEVTEITQLDRSTGQITIKRGIHDTVPAPIFPGHMHVYHWRRGLPVPTAGDMPAVSGGNHATVILPQNAGQPSKRRVQGANINPVRGTVFSRATLPARPAAATISDGVDTVGFAQGKLVLEEAVPVTLSWAPRNRMLDDANPAAWNQGPVTPEEGTFYYVRLWRRIRGRKGQHQIINGMPQLIPSTANAVAVWTGITGTSFTIPVQTILDNMADPLAMVGQGSFREDTDIFSGAAYAVEIGTYRGEFQGNQNSPASFQNPILLFDVAVDSTGYGLAYGKDYGGQ